jgi:hypothetical protein
VKGKIQMAVIVKEKVYELPDEGVHSLVISEIRDLGLVDTSFGTKDKALIVFDVQDQNDSEGNPTRVSVSVNKSLHVKSSLSVLLGQLGVVPGAEFDLEDLVGLQVKQGVIQHNVGKNGKTYANLTTVLKSKP